MNLDNLEQFIKPVVESLDLDLWGLEFIPATNRPTLRVYIESLNPDLSKIDADICQKVSQRLNAVLSVESESQESGFEFGVNLEDYLLEVSSPGLDRLLFKPKQFVRYIGSIINIRLINPLLLQDDTNLEQNIERYKFKGVLSEVDLNNSKNILLIVDGVEFEIALNNIAKARLVPVWK